MPYSGYATAYDWPKALFASGAAWGGGLLAGLAQIPWMSIIGILAGFVPPILKLIFDSKLRERESAVRERDAKLAAKDAEIARHIVDKARIEAENVSLKTAKF